MTKSHLRRNPALAAAALLAALPGIVLAEPVVVRAGEHDGFSRLVLSLPRALPWEIQSDGPEARLTLSNIEAEFDLSEAFQRLSDGRVTGLEPVVGQNALAISTSCDCEIEVFRHRTRYLVVDIRGTPNSLPPATPVPEPELAPVPAAQAGSPGAPVAAEPQPAPQQASENPAVTRRYFFPFETPHARTGLPMAFGNRHGAPPKKATEDAHAPPPSSSGDAAPETESQAPGSATIAAEQLDRTRRLSEAEQRLARQLSRAVSQGLVTPRAAHLPDPLVVENHGAKAEPHTAPLAQAGPPPTAPPSGPGINLRAETSVDRDFMLLFDALPQTANGDSCFSDTELDIASWGRDAPFGEQVGHLRTTLFGEFDRPNPGNARRLVQLYIHFGFGAEALQVLRASALTGDGTMLLKSMSEIMEYGHANGLGPLSNQFECGSAAALWAVLAHESIPEAARPNEDAILRALNALPPRLRGLLGPLASERLLSAGHKDLAAQILRIVERGHDKPDAPFEMADAGVQLAEGDDRRAARSLDSVVASNTELSPRALITLIDTRLKNSLPVDIQTANLAGAYAHEYRKEPLGTELKRVHMLALAEAGAFDQAFAELALFTANNPPEENRAVRSHAMAALARNAADLPFLKYALDTLDPEKLDLAPGSADAVADRLIGLGFAKEADIYLKPGGEGADGAARRLLRARAALAQGKPRRAEADLFGVEGPEADLMRARARAMTGDHDAARRLFAKLERQDDMIEQACLGSDWPSLRASGDSLWQDAAEMAATDVPMHPAETPGVLAHNRSLIEESVAARETMASLLDRMAFDAVTATGE